MKTTLSTSEAIDRLLADEHAGWSYEAAAALVNHFEEMEMETGTEIEFDAVAIRCEWSEYESPTAAAAGYCWEYEGEEEGEEREAIAELEALDWLRERTEVVTFRGGLVYRQF